MSGLSKDQLEIMGKSGLGGLIIYFLWDMNEKLGEIAAKLDYVFQWMAQGN